MPNTASKRVCVVDAGPLIHLDELGALNLLFALGQIFIPESVAYEAEKHRRGITTKLEAHVVAEAETLSRNLGELIRRFHLGAGEIAALAWVEAFGADLFVSDDTAARDAAGVLGYASTGTLGVIINAAAEDVISNADAVELLRNVPIRTTLFTTPALLEKVIAALR